MGIYEVFQKSFSTRRATEVSETEEKARIAVSNDVDPNDITPTIPWETWLENVEVSLITDLPAWQETLDTIRSAGVCAIDTETTGLDPLVNRIRLIQLAVPAGPGRFWAEDWKGPEERAGATVYVLDTFTLTYEDRLSALSMLADILTDKNVQKIGHNLKFDLAMLRGNLNSRRLEMRNIFDTMLASQLVWGGDFIPDPSFPKTCEKLGLKVFQEKQTVEYRRAREESRAGDGQEPTLDADGHWVLWERGHERYYPTHALQQVAHRHMEVWLDKTQQTTDWSGEIAEEQIRYAAKDAAILLPLAEVLSALLEKNGLAYVADLEMNCLPAVVEIELCGVPFDAPRARELKTEAQEKLDETVAALQTFAAELGLKGKKGKSWNWASPFDTLDALKKLADKADILGPNGGFLLDGKEEKAGTSDELLSRVSARAPGTGFAEFTRLLREVRSWKKQVDFYDKWLGYLHPHDDRIHPSLRQLNPNGVGRFSAREPNIQQVPRGSDTRALFKAPPGRKLVICDWSGIEMRIMGQLSRDETLLKIFKEGIDIHRYTASQLSGKPIEEVTKEERQASKASNFGLIYGMQGKTLQAYAETSYGVRMTLEEAEAARGAFFRTYPGVALWHGRQRQRMYADHFETVWRHRAGIGLYTLSRPTARTLTGRMRVWPVEEATSRTGRAYTRKVGPVTELFNTPDQGTGADMLKVALGMLYDALLERGWEDVRIIMCVHDEIILEAPTEIAEDVKNVLMNTMLAAAQRILPDVPVEAEAHIGDSWAEK